MFSLRRALLLGPNLLACTTLFALTAIQPAALQAQVDQDAVFAAEILPLLKQHCYECHSHASGEAKGGLVLDSRSGWATGGESGPAIVPGKPDESLLLSAVRYESLEMPPTGRLPRESVEKLGAWIARGAPDPRQSQHRLDKSVMDLEKGRQHWAYQPLRHGPLPRVQAVDWPRQPLDYFVLSKLEQQQIEPVSDADRSTWLRRVSFDLTGLPPTEREITGFLSDLAPGAEVRVVDRLLNSRAFGERWARHWLDLVGYADEIGTSNSVFAEHAWRYRDYVIRAYNSDKPFADFVREQVAGDLISQSTPESAADSLTATGFLVLGDLEIVEADKAKLLVDIVDQQVRKVSKAFLGMTIGCARCHDHKFDPIPQRDYYALGGFFHGTSTVFKTDRGVWSDVHVNTLPETAEQQTNRLAFSAKHQARLESLKTDKQETEQEVAEIEAERKDEPAESEKRKELDKKHSELVAKINRLTREIDHAEFFEPRQPVAYGVSDNSEPVNMRVTIRGNPRALGDEVPRGFLQVLSGEPLEIEEGQSGRRELADWLVSHDNPLTPRVLVNRVWQKLFGEGLVPSVDYFGALGQRPSHPELLDYLSSEFLLRGWSQKALIRSIVLSRTYRLDSVHSPHAHQRDPDNRLLWRMNRIRLDAEALRDSMIFVGQGHTEPSRASAIPLEYIENVGNLSPKSVNPPSYSLSKWRPGQEYRRTVYLPVLRHRAQPGPASLRNVFDFPQPSEFTGQRATTAVPTQALFLMNSQEVKRYAAEAAAELTREDSTSDERLERVWLRLLSRRPTSEERREAKAFLAASGEAGWQELCHALLATNEFLMRM